MAEAGAEKAFFKGENFIGRWLRTCIIARCNGAGKTTASYTVLPEFLHCFECVYADEIVKGCSPFRPEKVAVEAGRIMLNRIDELLHRGVDFAFETKLFTKTYKQKVQLAQHNNYKVTVLFIWLSDVNLAMERVRSGVTKRGQNIPTEVIKRRYVGGIGNLFDRYLPICDAIIIVDNPDTKYKLIAIIKKDQSDLASKENWQIIKSFRNEK